MKEISSSDIFVKDTGTARGRGVFAARAFAAGELIEECPVILIKIVFPFLPNEVKTYVFNWGNEKDGTSLFALALGYGSLYNHDNPANVCYEHDKNEHNPSIRFRTRRDIQQGEELTINYNSNPDDPDCNDWFERHKITPVVSGPL